MTQFIKVTSAYGKISYYINISKIESVFATESPGENRIVILGGYENYSYYTVKETPEEIMEMING